MPNMLYKQPLPYKHEGSAQQKQNNKETGTEALQHESQQHKPTERALFLSTPLSECLFTDSFEILRSNMLS